MDCSRYIHNEKSNQCHFMALHRLIKTTITEITPEKHSWCKWDKASGKKTFFTSSKDNHLGQNAPPKLCMYIIKVASWSKIDLYLSKNKCMVSKELHPLYHGLLETRTQNFKTTVKNVKIGLLFLSPFPQKLMKSFNFLCKSQTISLANVIKYQILKI